MFQRRLGTLFFIGALAMSCTACLGAPFLAWWYMVRPEVYRYATSSDGTWSAAIIRKQTSIAGTTDVILRVQDQQGRVLWQRRIDERDLWSDVDAGPYSELLIDADRIRVGPDFWADGSYFELGREDAEAGREVPTMLSGPGELKP
jgi:hypothetical protein